MRVRSLVVDEGKNMLQGHSVVQSYNLYSVMLYSYHYCPSEGGSGAWVVQLMDPFTWCWPSSTTCPYCPLATGQCQVRKVVLMVVKGGPEIGKDNLNYFSCHQGATQVHTRGALPNLYYPPRETGES